MAQYVRQQIKVITKAADRPGKAKAVREYVELTKRFQEERLQAETREAYLTLVAEQNKTLKAEAQRLGL